MNICIVAQMLASLANSKAPSQFTPMQLVQAAVWSGDRCAEIRKADSDAKEAATKKEEPKPNKK